MRRAMVLALAVGLVVASAATAGVYVESVTKTEGAPNAEMGTMKVKMWAAGDQARVEFTESGNPMMAAGSYLITKDGGKTMFLVNPKEKTYMQWDMQGMMGAAGDAMKAARGMFTITFTDPKVEKLGEEAGGPVAGLPTTHYRYRTSYATEMKIMGMKQRSSTVQEEDIWSTGELVERALGVWLKNDPPKTGDEQLDKLMQMEMGKVQGFPLKRVTKTTTTDGKGKAQTTTMTMEVTTLQVMPVSDDRFVIPVGYTEQQMPGLAGQEGEEQEGGEDNPFLKMMGKKKGKG